MTTYNLDIVIKAIDQASSALKSVGSSLGTLGQEASSTAQSLQPLGIGLAALSAAGGALIATSAMTAARVEVLGTVLNTVGKHAGYSATELAAFEADLMEAGITAGASRQGLIQMAQAEIDLASATDLARLAQDAAVIANINSSDAYERLITGIQRGQPILLRTMGITVDFQGAYKEMAAQLGKTTLELSASEKIQARVNEVMKAGGAIAGVYKDAMGDVGKKLGSVKGDIQDAANALGKAYLPAMEAGVDATRDALEWFTALDEGTQRNIATFLGLGTAVTGTAGAIILATPKIIAMGSSIVTLAGLASNAGAAFSLVAGGANMAGVASLGLAGVIGGVVLPLTLATTAAVGLYIAFDKIGESAGVVKDIPADMNELAAASILLDGSIGSLSQTNQEAFDTFNEVAVATSNLTDGWTSQYSPALIEARAQTDGWATSLELAGQPLGELSEVTTVAAEAVIGYTNTLGMLKEALEGPVSEANEEYRAQQARINREIAEAEALLVELGAQHGNYDVEIAETGAQLNALEGELVSLGEGHRSVMNNIIYDMMMARLATDGWTAAETELALGTARAMGIIDEETWAAATSMNAALDSFAEGESLSNTMLAIMGISDEMSGLPSVAEEAGMGIGSGLQSGAQVGIDAFDGVTAAIGRIPRTIDITTHWHEIGVPPAGTPGAAEQYQHGTDYVPRTGWAYLHRGEAILSAPVAAQYRAGDTNINLTANYAYQSERRLRDDVRMLQLLAGA